MVYSCPVVIHDSYVHLFHQHIHTQQSKSRNSDALQSIPSSMKHPIHTKLQDTNMQQSTHYKQEDSSKAGQHMDKKTGKSEEVK